MEVETKAFVEGQVNMAPDEARLHLIDGEERDLFEMANLYPRTTGLPVTVWVSPRGGARHDVRVKVSSVPGDRMDLEGAAVLAVRPGPELLQGHLSADVRRAVDAWIKLNTAALVEYWNGDLDTVELGMRLRRHEG